MARKTRNRWILLVVMAMILATVGVVYAHWTSSLIVDTNVNTGNVAMGWYDVHTNDDGADNGDGEPVASPTYDDMWGEGSSADPANSDGSERYDKDVAACWGGGGGDHASFQLENGYPSYYCAMFALAMNEGSVPVRATSLSVRMGGESCYFPGLDGYNWVGDESSNWLDDPSDDFEYEGDEFGLPWILDPADILISGDEFGEFADFDGDGVFDEGDGDVYMECFFEERTDLAFMPGEFEGNFAIGYYDEGVFIPELTGDIAMGIRCGTQVDPGEEDAIQTAGWIHVEQEARQNFNWNWQLKQDFVNWNEFSYFLCTEGTVATDANGNPIGIVDHTQPEGYLPFPPE